MCGKTWIARLRAVLILLVAVSAASVFIQAQTFYGGITGTVTDAGGAIVPSATVTITNIGTNEKHAVQSNAEGEYHVVDLVPAVYRVEVEAKSFKRYVQDSVTVQVDTTIRVDAKLQVGAASETVEVTTEPPMLQTESGSVGAEVEAKVVASMPLNGRNSMNLLTLVPGVIAQSNANGPIGGNSGNSHTQINGFGNYAIAGGIGNESGNYIDGSPVNMLGGNPVGLILSQDVVQEFKISMNAVSPEFGRFGGGVVEMASKSGSNQFHGTAYDYIRNTLLNAMPFYYKFAKQPVNFPGAPPYHLQQYGGTIGGPVLKDKIFAFFGIENYQQHITASGNGTVPTAIMRGQSTDYPNMAVIHNTVGIADDSTKGCPIVTNPMGPGTNTWGIPASCWDASAQVMKQFYPLPNAPGVTQDSFAANGVNDWLSLAKVGNNTLSYTARGDVNLSSKQRAFGRYSYWHIADIPTDNYAGTTLPFDHVFGQTRFFNHGITIGDTYTVNPNTVADVRLSWDRMTQLNYPDPAQNKTNEAAFGPAYATVAPSESYHNQPQISFGSGNYVNYQLTAPFSADQTDVFENYTLNASLVKIMGKHTVKVGGESTLRNHSGIGNSPSYGGNFTFSPHETGLISGSGLANGSGDEYASFMLGALDSYIWQTIVNSFTIDWSHALFATDTWQLSQNLTLTLGGRWEYPGGLYEKKDRAAVFLPNGIDPSQSGSSLGGVPNPQHMPGTLALVNSAQSPGRGMSVAHKDLFGPRVSFAERVKGNAVVRGGFGISYLPPDMETGLMAFNSPVNGYQTQVKVNYAGGTQAAPGYFLANPLPTTAPAGYLSSFPGGLLPQPSTRVVPYPSHLYYGNTLDAPVVDKRDPYMEQWNLAYSKQWKGDLLTEVAYMGSKGTHLPDAGIAVSGNNGVSGIDMDELNPMYFSMGNAALTAKTTTCPNYNGTNAISGAVISIPMYQCLEPYPQYANVLNTGSNGGSSHYNAVYVSVQKRFRSGGVINGNYTRSKAIDDTDQPGSGNNFQDFYNRAAEKSVSNFDIPNRMVVSYVFDLPFGKGQKWLNSGGLMDIIAGGWQMNSIVQMQSGGAYAFTYNNSSFLFSQGSGNAGTSRPDILPGCNLKGSGGNAYHKLLTQTSGQAWFNAACIVPPGVTGQTVAGVNGSGAMTITYGGTSNPLEFGSAPRSLGTIRGPINQNWDLSLSKSTSIWEHTSLLLRAEVFDLWNHAQFGNAGSQLTTGNNSFDFVNGNNIANSGFGGMRLIQLSGRVNF